MGDRHQVQQRYPVALLAVCASLTATFFACSDDPIVATDASVTTDGGKGGTVVQDASKESATSDGAMPDVVTADTTGRDVVGTDVWIGDSGAGDADSGGAAGSGGAGGAGPGDAAIDVVAADSPSGDSSDAMIPEAAAEADAAEPLPPLELCPTLDTAWGITTADGCATKTTNECNDRSPWIVAVWDMFPNDCRVDGTLWGLTQEQMNEWSQDFAEWAVFFFGCPQPTASPGNYAVIPKARRDHVYTTADLKTFGDAFIQVTRDNLSFMSAPDFTTDQLAAIEARMSYLRARYEGSVITSTSYSSSTCPVDAGSDATPE